MRHHRLDRAHALYAVLIVLCQSMLLEPCRHVWEDAAAGAGMSESSMLEPCD